MDYKYFSEPLYQETIALIKEIYELHSGGGQLHIVLGDGNVEDENIQWCIDNLECEPEEREIYLKCANNLLMMKECRRSKVIDKALEVEIEYHTATTKITEVENVPTLEEILRDAFDYNFFTANKEHFVKLVEDLKAENEKLNKALELVCTTVDCDRCPLEATKCDSWRGVETGCSKAISKWYIDQAEIELKE